MTIGGNSDNRENKRRVNRIAWGRDWFLHDDRKLHGVWVSTHPYRDNNGHRKVKGDEPGIVRKHEIHWRGVRERAGFRPSKRKAVK